MMLLMKEVLQVMEEDLLLGASAGGLDTVVVVVDDGVETDHRNQDEPKENWKKEGNGCESGADGSYHWGLWGCQRWKGCGGECLRVL